MTPSVPIFPGVERVALTALFGDRDRLEDPGPVPNGWRAFCFTDVQTHPGWRIVRVEPPFAEPGRSAKVFKYTNSAPAWYTGLRDQRTIDCSYSTPARSCVTSLCTMSYMAPTRKLRGNGSLCSSSMNVMSGPRLLTTAPTRSRLAR